MFINVNGTTYTDWAQVPPDVRRQLAATLPDADRNGIPDLFEGKGLSELVAQARATGGQPLTSTAITVNGQTVQSMGALPQEVQDLMRQAFGWPVAPTPAASTATTAATPVPPPAPGLQPGQVLLNGVPTTTEAAAGAPRKSWWRRLFGG